MNDQVPIGLIGISHKTASVEIREMVALSEEEQKTALQGITSNFEVGGCMILSTCNRTELYISCDDCASKLNDIRIWMNQFKGCQFYTDDKIVFAKSGIEVVSHFFEVLSGLDSQIIGEQQISAQVKESYDLAHNLNVTDAVINKLFNFAMQAKKKVHNETFLSDGTVSVSFAGVELARKIFSELTNKEILLIGAGKTAELAAYHFQESGAKKIHVVNRTFSRAQELADKFEGKSYDLAELPSVLEMADIVISATSGTEYVVKPEMVAPIAKKRKHKPIFLIDLAIPRDIDPAIDAIDGIFLYNLDDLNEIVKMNLEKRKKEIPKAMKIVKDYTSEFQDWMSTHSMTAIIGRLKKRFETIRLNEIEKLKKQLPPNGYQEEINNLTQNIINKLIRQHVKSLKMDVGNPERYQQQVDLLNRLYELDQD